MANSENRISIFDKFDKLKKNGISILIGGLALLIFLLIVLILSSQLREAKQELKEANASHTINLRFEDIGELATQVAYFTNVQIISNSRNVFGIEVPFTQNKYIFSYDGVIRAGVDFTKVEYEIDHEAKKVCITLPEARIMGVDADEDSLRVYDETKNIFTPLKLEDIETSRKKMEEEAENQAINNGIKEAAYENAKILLRTFLLGNESLSNYEIVWK